MNEADSDNVPYISLKQQGLLQFMKSYEILYWQRPISWFCRKSHCGNESEISRVHYIITAETRCVCVCVCVRVILFPLDEV
jgi:hypothetical protein